MAHNQYSLQEQLAQATASNAKASSTNINNFELAALRGQQLGDALQNATVKGTSNLYEDDDISALLQRFDCRILLVCCRCTFFTYNTR